MKINLTWKRMLANFNFLNATNFKFNEFINSITESGGDPYVWFYSPDYQDSFYKNLMRMNSFKE